MNVNGLITRVLEHVLDDDPDYPNERWSRDQILFHVRHALLLFAVLEPGSFTCVKRELLTPGGTIKLPSDCSTFIEATAVYDAKRGGRSIRPCCTILCGHQHGHRRQQNRRLHGHGPSRQCRQRRRRLSSRE